MITYIKSINTCTVVSVRFVTSTKFNFNVTILVSNDLMASTIELRESKQYLMILTILEIIEAKLVAELMTE